MPSWMHNALCYSLVGETGRHSGDRHLCLSTTVKNSLKLKLVIFFATTGDDNDCDDNFFSSRRQALMCMHGHDEKEKIL